MSTQGLLNLGHELVIDLFAGGGGTSLGIEMGIGRAVDIAVNHDSQAVSLHRVNHPHTEHFCESVFKVDPRRVTRDQPVGLLHASPDCTHHSKAKGGKPVSKKIRGLAWVVVKWARRTRPRVITLENVEEFADWGPVGEDGRPCKRRKGQDFDKFIGQLERLGYVVEHCLLRACDYGAPTIRKRLFLVARRDGRPIVWPKPTHAAPDDQRVKRGQLLPYRTAAECIDWSIPCPSIFERKKPLAENTMRRIAKGIQRFVLDCQTPFIVTCNHSGTGFRGQDLKDPMKTVTSAYDAHGLVAPFIAKHRASSVGSAAGEPLHTVTAGCGTAGRPGTGGAMSVVAPYFVPRHGEREGQAPRTRDTCEPMPTVTGTASGASLVAAFMSTYYGNGAVCDPREPTHTVTSKDRLQLVTTTIEGETYVLTDIGMRMLQPRELYRAQGFPDSYVIDRDEHGNRLPKHAQVRMCGNSVCPPVAAALVSANFEHEALIKGVA